jgi:hypothetical protein
MFHRPAAYLAKSSPARFELQTPAPCALSSTHAPTLCRLLKRRELRGQWQDVGELTKALELALFFDSKLDLTVMA